LQKWARLVRWIVKSNRLPSRDEFYACADLMEKRRKIGGRSSGTQHRDFPAFESAQIAVV